ncbi:MAG TPA: carbohydrate ABC transporter permease [Bacteroidota bacterium]|nr:carbohydrate ABC transporter permease [Bacteroidota bacterium]
MIARERTPLAALAGITLRWSATYGALALLGALFVLPLGWMLSVSLQDAQGVFAQPFRWIPAHPRWENFAVALGAIPFGRYFVNTAVITGCVLLLTLFSCSLVAFGFSRIRFRGRNLLFAVCLATMMLPGQVTMIPLYIAYARLGWVDTYLPLIVPAAFGSPFYIFLLRQFFLTIPREYDEAALIDGAGRFRIYWSVILPLARPALATVALFCFIGTWNDFFGPLIYLNSPEKATVTLGLNMLKSQIIGSGSVQWHVLMAASLLVMVPNIVVFVIAQKQLVRGIQAGGLRG